MDSTVEVQLYLYTYVILISNILHYCFVYENILINILLNKKNKIYQSEDLK